MSDQQFFVTGGALRADAGCYVARAADTDLLDALRRGEFCYILTSRQMGKSSLMVRAAVQLRSEGNAVVILDLTAIGQNLDVEQWYFSMLCHIGERTGLESEMDAYWNGHEGQAPLRRFFGAIVDVYLTRERKPLVIFVDEIDAVRSLRRFSADEFFAGIRECYNRRPEDPRLQRLTFCLLGVATPSDLIRDDRITPFNIGHAIELRDFTRDDASVLAAGLSPQRETAMRLLDRVLWWTSGQPYLTQKLCAEVAQMNAHSPAQVDEACARIFLSPEARERDDNLHFVRDRILRSEQERAALLDTCARVDRGERVEDDRLNPVVSELRLSGIVRVQDGVLRPRNRIYSKVFDRRWIQQNLPDAEKLRQRAAYYRGIRRVAGVAVVVLTVFGALAFQTWRNAKEAQRNAKEAQRNARAAQAATEREQKADSDLLREAGRTKSALNQLVETQSKVEALLEALTPLVGDESGKAILDRAEDVVRSVSNESSDDRRVVLGLAGLRRVCGRLYLRLGNQEAALNQAEQARRLVESTSQQGSADPSVQKQLHDCLILIGDAILRGRKGDALKQVTPPDYAKARQIYQQTVDLAANVLRSHPDDATWRALYFSDLNYLGDTAQLFGPDRAAEAEADYKHALQIAADYRQHNKASADLSRIEAVIHDRLGTLYLAIGRRTEARSEYDAGLKLSQGDSSDQLADDLERQAELAFGLNKLGTLFQREGELKEALDYYQRSLAIRRTLCQQKKQREWQRNLGFSLHNVARMQFEIGYKARNVSMMHTAFDLSMERLQLCEKLTSEDSSDGDLKVDYANSLYDCADLLLNSMGNAQKEWAKALQLAQMAVGLTDRRDPRLLALLAQALRFAGRKEEAFKTAEEAEKLLPPPEKRTDDEKDVAAEVAYEIKRNRSAKMAGAPTARRR